MPNLLRQHKRSKLEENLQKQTDQLIVATQSKEDFFVIKTVFLQMVKTMSDILAIDIKNIEKQLNTKELDDDEITDLKNQKQILIDNFNRSVITLAVQVDENL